MNDKNREHPACFADLNIVFPKGKDGLRHSPESCMVCFYKTKCLKTALAGTDGVAIRRERVDRAYAAGRMGFLERWARRKALAGRKNATEKDPARH